ncbi:MAG: hypothetical protein LBD20_00985, partial [Spirochaetaceae bacterium]|nr:hypothetical protein [Spirochaetaceae bacterium]
MRKQKSLSNSRILTGTLLGALLLSVTLLVSCGDLEENDDSGGQPALIYSFTLSEAGAYTFNSVPEGVYEPQTVDVTVANIADVDTGVITIGITGDDADKFTLSVVPLDSIASAGSDTFSVSTTTGLSMGTYTATITATGDTGSEDGEGSAGEDGTFKKTFTVLFTEGDPILELQIVSGGQSQQPLQFGEKIAGYTAAPAVQEITVENTGTQALTGVMITGGGVHYTVDPNTGVPIAAGGSAAFSVQPQMELPSGSYPATLTVGTALASAEFEAAFSVRNGRISTSLVENGSISVDPETAAPGAVVTVTVTPDTNYAISPGSLTAMPATALTMQTATQYTFTMPPNTNVRVEAGFIQPNSDNRMATGGTVSIVDKGNGEYDEVHIFTTVGDSTLTVHRAATATVTLVAGGGGGGVLRNQQAGLAAGSSYNLTVGAGGADWFVLEGNVYWRQNTDGSDTVFKNASNSAWFTAKGGGGGGGGEGNVTVTSKIHGLAGGSGGGGGKGWAVSAGNGGNGTNGQGTSGQKANGGSYKP